MAADKKIDQEIEATDHNANDEMRFGFGKNWQNFLKSLNDERIAEAEKSLKLMLRIDTLEGKTFIDIGSGSGLLSLAARRLGARVVSIDYDPQSVACTKALKDRFFNNDDEASWQIEQGSALDQDYLESLGQFDIVYSWGVLHHTGNMWQALANVAPMVKPDGLLFISLYNDEGWRSKLWTAIKKTYNALPAFLQPAMAFGFLIYDVCKGAAIDLLRLKNPFQRYKDKIKERGMTVWYDTVDWIGGYPFEVARPGHIFDFYFEKGFSLIKLNTLPRGHGCNEFVFKKSGGQ